MLDWIDPSMKCHVWKMEKKSFLLFCCPVSQILIASAFVNSKRGACDRFQMIFMSVPREFKRAVPAQQNQPDLIGWDWKKVQIAPTLIDGCNNGWFPTLYSASWLHWFQAFLEDCHHATMGKLDCTLIPTSLCCTSKKEKKLNRFLHSSYRDIFCQEVIALLTRSGKTKFLTDFWTPLVTFCKNFGILGGR